MERSTKIGLTILGLTILISWLVIFFVFIFPMFRQMSDFRRQMLAGQKYMDSLTEKDFQVWSNRTQQYFANYNSTNLASEIDGVPPELAALKIVRIDKESDCVDFVWMGGFDHTYLHVEKQTNGFFKFTAVYNDESNKVIWPKPANQ